MKLKKLKNKSLKSLISNPGRLRDGVKLKKSDEALVLHHFFRYSKYLNS